MKESNKIILEMIEQGLKDRNWWVREAAMNAIPVGRLEKEGRKSDARV